MFRKSDRQDLQNILGVLSALRIQLDSRDKELAKWLHMVSESQGALLAAINDLAERPAIVAGLIDALSGKLLAAINDIAKLGSDIRDGIINECEEIRRRDKKVELWQRKSDLYRDQRDKLLQEATSQPPRKRARKGHK